MSDARHNSLAKPRRGRHRTGMSLYLTVMSTALIVSTLGLAAMSVVRVERRHAATINDRQIARTNARSAIEWALRVLASDPNWRTNYASGVETATQSSGTNGRGTLSWSVSDSDGSLTNSDVLVTVKGIGRVGDLVQVSGIQINPSVVGPGLLRGQTSSTGNSTDDVKNDKWYCQYLKLLTLPPEATGWRVTSVEIYAARKNGSRTFTVGLYQPLANNLPSSTLIASADVNSNDVASSLGWHTINLTGNYWLNPTDGICLTVTTTSSSAPIELHYKSGGMSEANSALSRGTPSWPAYETDKALRYRINGIYTTTSSIPAVAGTWSWGTP